MELIQPTFIEPLSETDRRGLRIISVNTIAELAQLEQQNIERAIEWTLSRKFSMEQLLSVKTFKILHYKMLGSIWEWAGKFKNDASLTNLKLEIELERAKLNILNKNYTPPEIALRLKHGLIRLECFNRGNGRHSRIIADMMMESVFGLTTFSWGHCHSIPDRKMYYRNALVAADHGNFDSLMDFAHH